MKAEKRRDAGVLGLVGKLTALMVLALLLAGCPDSDKSTEFPFDKRELTNPIQNWDRDVYRGRVMNGNLENAVVWLDMEGNGELSPGDPWAWSDANGEFFLDITDLQRELFEGPDLDPRDFPLMAVAVPGYTKDQHTGNIIDHAFFLMAPPGRTLISPFSTMVEARRRLSFTPEPASRGEALTRAATDVRVRMAGAEEEISVLQDYQRSDTPRAPFYAEALRRFIQAQVPDDISNAIQNGSGDPEVSAFSREDLQVIGTLMLDQIGAILAEVDTLISQQGVDGFVLPAPGALESIVDLGPDLRNPLLLRKQTVFVPPEDDPQGLDASSAEDNGQRAARVFYNYDVSTRVRNIEVRGISRPSMTMLGALTNSVGRMAELKRQPWLDVVFDDQAYDGAIRERFFNSDPDSNRIRWGDFLSDTPAFRIDLDSAELNAANGGELDGMADRAYQVPEKDAEDRVKRFSRIIPYQGGGTDTDAGLEINYASEEFTQVINMPQVFADGEVELTFSAIEHFRDIEGCDEPASTGSAKVINARQRVTIDGESASGVLTRYGHLRDAVDGDYVKPFRVIVEQLILDGDTRASEHREFEYFDHDGSLLSEEQPDLTRSVRVWLDRVAINEGPLCNNDEGSDYSLNNSSMSAYILFEYLTFSEYLREFGGGN